MRRTCTSSVVEVDAQFVRFVKSKALAGAVDQRAFDDDVGTVYKALAFGKREDEEGQGRSDWGEAKADLLDGKNLAQVYLEPPILWRYAFRWAPAGVWIAVEGAVGASWVGAGCTDGRALERIDIFTDQHWVQSARLLELQRAGRVRPTFPYIRWVNSQVFGPDRA